MTITPILEYPDERLREHSKAVTEFGGPIDELSENLIDTLYSTEAVALSAPQIGSHQQALVFDLSPDRSAPQIFINPEITAKAAWGFVEESCLSLPDIKGSVLRATKVQVRAHRPDGSAFEEELSGMPAVCLQHEMDHLVGKLFIDKMSIFRRLSIRARTKARLRTENQERHLTA
ncbi:MAG: peptide deformylase [Pseudomonadota bacterium]